MNGGERIFMWIIVIFVLIVITVTIVFIIIKTPGQTILNGGLDLVPVSEPPDPVGLTYDCQQDTDCKQGLVCDTNDYTCRMANGSKCYHASDCKFGLICSGVCIKPDEEVDLGMNTYVDSRYVCNPYGLPCNKGAGLGDTGNPNGAFCCVKCTADDKNCTPETTCGPVSSQDGYTVSCSDKHRNCPCQNGKGCVPSYGVANAYECRVLPDNPCVCSSDCVSRSCIYYADGTSSKYPVGICRGPVGNGQYCTVNEGCLSGNCALVGGSGGSGNYGYCQPAGINNGDTGAYCNISHEPLCKYGSTCLNNTCTAPNSYGLNLCDNTGNICTSSFFCASPSIAGSSSGATGNISINMCDGNGNCICLYGNPAASAYNNTTPDPIGLGINISNCMNGMSALIKPPNKYCIPTVENTPAGFMNSAPCVIDSNCAGSACKNEPSLYRFLPITSSIFPVNGIQGLNGIYYERIPLTPLLQYGTITKIVGVSVGWQVNNCDANDETNLCQTLDRGSGDIIFVLLTGQNKNTIMYKSIINGPNVEVDQGVMDGGDPNNRSESGWQVLFSYPEITSFDAFWTNNELTIYVLWKDLISLQTQIYKAYINPDTGYGGFYSNDKIRMPTVTVGWTSISCSDYYSTPTTGSLNASLMLSNGSLLCYCPNAGLYGNWTNISSSGKGALGYGVYKKLLTPSDPESAEYYGYPAYGKIFNNNSYTYFSQPNITTGNGSNYTFSKIQYPQNTYISNLSADIIGTIKPIVPEKGSTVSDYAIVNVAMTTPADNIVRFMHFAYIAKWGNDDKYYVYYVGTGFSMVLPTYIDSTAKVVITPGNLYIYSANGCISS